MTRLVVLQLVVYSYFFTTLIFTNHTFPNSWVSSYPSFRTTGEGRWLADLIIRFQGGSGVQPFQMAVAVSIQGVNGILFARVLGLQRHLEVALFAAFLCLYPAFLDNYSFGIDHITFTIADTFALVGTLRLKCSEISAGNALVVAVFFILTLASYQPKLALLGLLCLCYLLMRLADSSPESPGVLQDGVRAMLYVSAIFLTACLLYFVSVKISVSYDSGDRSYMNSLSEMVSQVLGAYKHFFRYYTYEADYLPRSLGYLPAVIVALGCLAVLGRVYRRHVAALALAAVLLLLMPVGLRAPYIINQNAWENAGRITFANGYALLFFLWCGLQVVRLRMLIVGLLAVFLYFFVVVGTQESNAAALKTVYDLNMINRIASRIETEVSGLYTKAHALVVIGQYPDFPRQQYVRYANRGISNHTRTGAFAPYRQTEILNYFFGRDVLRRPTPLQLENALATVGGRPLWPARDSVYVADDVVVVMLQNYRPDVVLTWTTEQ